MEEDEERDWVEADVEWAAERVMEWAVAADRGRPVRAACASVRNADTPSPMKPASSVLNGCVRSAGLS